MPAPVLDPFLRGILPFALAVLPLARPLPAWLGIDTAPLVALELVKDLPDPCPSGMTLVDGDWCPTFGYACQRYVLKDDTYRCSEYARLGSCRVPQEPRRYCIDLYEWPNLVGENPRVYVSWYQARDLCAAVGKRLCRRSEWTMACEGPKRLPYPYGYVRQPSPCNIDRSPVAFDVGAMIDPSTRDEELSRLWQADPIGSHPACVSAWGVFDMTGNVDEWTDNQADDPHATKVSTLNGGYWGPVRDTCRLATSSHGPSFEFYQAGFRCCADAADGVETPPVIPHGTP
jgi:hypothetical protein